MFNSPHINYFAQTDFRGRKTPFGIKSEDRARHMYVIGKTGMGKSTMLENLAIQDIKNGEGLGFIDPHGQAAEKLLEYVPEERMDDVMYFAPFDLDWPVAFNIMEDVGKDKRHLVANGLMATFKKIWPDVWSPRMEYILGNTILALLEYPNSTLLGVNRMLSDKKYREKVVDNISDPTVKSFWTDEFAKYNERYMQEAGDAIKNKIGQFSGNPLIRNIIGQPKSTFDIREMMDEKKILIMNLSKGRVGEQNASLLGGMLVTKIYLAAMSRAEASEAELRNLPFFYLYVDEFQSFVNESFTDILSEARKYKLSLTIAHQYVEQMPEEVRSAVFGNIGTIVSFRVGPLDAELLEKIFMPDFTQEDIVNLGFAQIYLTLMVDGVGSPPFSAVTLPPIIGLEDPRKEELLEQSRRSFARPREQVEKEIIAWHEALSKDSSSDQGKNKTADKGTRMFGKNTGKAKKSPENEKKQNKTGSQSPSRQSDQSKNPGELKAGDQKTKPVSLSALKSKKEAPEMKDKKAGSQKHKDDLRSVLQGLISDTDTGRLDDPVKGSNQKGAGTGSDRSEKQEETSGSEPTLKDLLEKESRDEAPKEEKVKKENSYKKTQEPESKIESNDPERGKTEESPRSQVDSGLSPEELKRILEVTDEKGTEF